MLGTVLKTIRAHGLVAAGERVLVAVSGGPDSMALLHVLWEAAARLDVRLEVATIDHGLRPEARAEGELVRARAEALELPWHGLRVDVASARRPHGGLQEAARRARLAALADLAARRGAARVALGHQADDQAETVLFRIVRGTGLHGLAGIPYRRGPFVRPLLDVTRAELARYLRRRSIPHVEDPSNADLRFARARVRHTLLPLLAQENPRVREALVGLASAARAVSPEADDDDDLPADIGRRAASVVARLRRAAAGTKRIDVSGHRVVEVSYGRVRVGRAGARSRTVDEAVEVPGPGTYALEGGAALSVRATATDARDGATTFDADVLPWPLALRTRREGDRMRPRGGRGSRKLADLLIDAKIPRGTRDELPVLATREGVVLFVPGLRPSELGRPTAATKHFVQVAAVPHASDRSVPGQKSTKTNV
jgi:tRNA(Ile)-lysidine synthase